MTPLRRAASRAIGTLAVATLAVLGWGCAGVSDALPPRAGDPLPDLEVRTLGGELVRLSSYGGRPLLLNLWATWCPPCRAEMPYLQELSDRYAGRGLAVVGISVDNASAADLVREFLSQSGVEYDILMDPAGASMDALGVVGLPATFLVDAQGTVRHIQTGPVDEEDRAFLDRLEALVDGAPVGGGGS